MSKYYVIDSTIKQNGQHPVILFETIPGVIKKLEDMCVRRFNQSRREYMLMVESVGHGGDEATGRSFFDQMEQYFSVGVIRKDSTPIKCNIFQADHFLGKKSVHGD